MKNDCTLQELAEFLRNVAYADEQTHCIDWSLSVIHPRTNDGDVGFSGGLWTHNRVKELKQHLSLSFSYSETKGIYCIMHWKDKCRIGDEKTMSFKDFKPFVISLFGVEVLFNPDEKGK